MTKLLSRDEIRSVLTTNLQEWKKQADICECEDLNNELTSNEISTIIRPEFYDDINDLDLSIDQVLDKHFLDTNLSVYQRETFILIHNIYNN